MSTNPIQQIAQEILTAAVTEDEELLTADPPAIPTPSIEEKQLRAYDIWEANGAVQNDPLTLNNWLAAEVLLEARTPTTHDTE